MTGKNPLVCLLLPSYRLGETPRISRPYKSVDGSITVFTSVFSLSVLVFPIIVCGADVPKKVL